MPEHCTVAASARLVGGAVARAAAVAGGRVAHFAHMLLMSRALALGLRLGLLRRRLRFHFLLLLF